MLSTGKPDPQPQRIFTKVYSVKSAASLYLTQNHDDKHLPAGGLGAVEKTYTAA